VAIRIRTICGFRVALCAAETDPEEGDVYLDDADHYALSAKFMRDCQENGLMSPSDVIWREWAVMDTQKKRSAAEEAAKWQVRMARGEAPNCVTTIYNWDDPLIPQKAGWLVTDPIGRTFAFVGEPRHIPEEPPEKGIFAWCEFIYGVERDAIGRRSGWVSFGDYCFNSPDLIGIKEKRPSGQNQMSHETN